MVVLCVRASRLWMLVLVVSNGQYLWLQLDVSGLVMIVDDDT
jgi:hypothetical protein